MSDDIEQRDLPQTASASNTDWGALEDLLADFARLAKSEVPFRQVAAELVDCLTDALAAIGAALWLVDGRGGLRLERQMNLGVLGDSTLADSHRGLLLETLQHGRAEVISPHGGSPGDVCLPYHLILVPVLVDREAVGLVEVIQRPTIGADALQGNLRFAALLGELTADYLRRREVRELKRICQQSKQFDEFIRGLHATLDPRQTAYELANEGRRQIGCDRVSVAVRRGRRYALGSVSAVDTIHRRSAAVQRLERLVARAMAQGEAFWYDGQEVALADPLEKALAAYLDESHARYVGILPLTCAQESGADARRANVGALVVEGFDAGWSEAMQETATAVARHGGLALANAMRYRALPTLPFLRSRYKASGTLGRRLLQGAALLVLITAVASTFFITKDFYVYAQGELQPVDRSHTFAPLDAIVARVAVGHGDQVAAGQPLIELLSPELDLEIQKIQGEYDATLQRSLAIESALLDYGSSREPETTRFNQLAAEQEELRELIESQQLRLAVLRQQREQLVVRSPIAGEVLTWETDDQLKSRPVRRGQHLLSVANLQGDWEAQLRVPDDRVGPLLDRIQKDDTPVMASFQLETQRGAERPGTILRVAGRTEMDADNRPIVQVVMQVDSSSLSNPRPGASVFARIHCGQRSLFYIWCHPLVDRVSGWLMF
jgi:multidrug efflux pump subunit AcrA (membrane-fusion protein)